MKSVKLRRDRSGSSRIVLDIGIPLFDADGEPFNSKLLEGKTTKELLARRSCQQSQEYLPGFFSRCHPSSHAHLDHTGFLGHTRRKIRCTPPRGHRRSCMLVG